VRKSTSASKSSAASRLFEVLAAITAAATIGALALRWFSSRGWLLWYGDAEAHLNTARRLIDSRTPNYDQIGTYWLPLPHWIPRLLIGDDSLWRTGLAGAVPSMAAFVAAAVFLFLAVRRIFSSTAAAFAALALFAGNPNVLYLSSIPMTEPYFFAALFGLLYFTTVARQTASVPAALAAGAMACAGTLTRYEGWFLLPFATVYLLTAPKRRIVLAASFAVIAGLGPLYWAAHHWYLTGDPFDFLYSEYSAKGIYERQVKAGMDRYRGDHDWSDAFLYFREAARLCAGLPLVVLGLGGLLACAARRAFWPVALLILPPVFYVWNVHSSGTPIFVPHLWPSGAHGESYYNTRYGLAALPLLVLGAAAIVAILPNRWRIAAAVAVPLAAASPWMLRPSPENWICWKESQVNSEARRAWTRQAADYMREHYKGGGIFTSLGDVAAVYREAGIPLRETLSECNWPHWGAVLARPDLFLWEEWAVAIAGDKVATTIQKAQRQGPRYECVKMIIVKGGPVIEIYRRGSRANAHPLSESPRGG
jgi:hypothetical protein